MKLKSSRKLMDEIDEIESGRDQVLKMSDEVVVDFVLDGFDDYGFSDEAKADILEVSEAFRVTLSQLLDKEVDRKAGLLDKIKLKGNESERDS